MKNKKVILGVLAILVVVAIALFASNPALFQGRLSLEGPSIGTSTPVYKTIAKGVSLKSSNPIEVALRYTSEDISSTHQSLEFSERDGTFSSAFVEIVGGSDGSDSARLQIYDKNLDGSIVTIKKGDRLRLQSTYSNVDYYLTVKNVLSRLEGPGVTVVTVLFEVVQKNR